MLGPIPFSLFCHDLLVAAEGKGDIHIYADDTVIYVVDPSPGGIAIPLNDIFSIRMISVAKILQLIKENHSLCY